MRLIIPLLKAQDFVPRKHQNVRHDSQVSASLSIGRPGSSRLCLAVALALSFGLSSGAVAEGTVSGSSDIVTQAPVALGRQAQELIAAAQEGDPQVQYILGLCCKTGHDVPKDSAAAIKWLGKAAEKGLAEAQYALGCCYNGEDGCVRDSARAVTWWKKAAEQGNVDAQYCLALSYFAGEGVDKSHLEAARWWRKAAEQNHADAQYYLGVCYSHGLGVPKARDQAVFWLRKALAGGRGDALALLAELK